MDPLSAAITAAVDAAIEARLPKLLDAVKAVVPRDPSVSPERFVPMVELETILHANRSTIWRRSRAGKSAILAASTRRLSVGLYASDLEAIFAKPEEQHGAEFRARREGRTAMSAEIIQLRPRRRGTPRRAVRNGETGLPFSPRPPGKKELRN